MNIKVLCNIYFPEKLCETSSFIFFIRSSMALVSDFIFAITLCVGPGVAKESPDPSDILSLSSTDVEMSACLVSLIVNDKA